MKVRELMTKEVFSLRPDHKLDLASDLMKWQRIRHIPVVDKMGDLVGMVTHRDLLRAAVSSLVKISTAEQLDIYSYIPIVEIMIKKVTTINPDAKLRDAAKLMLDQKLGCLPVVEGSKLVGIITESDFLKLAWEQL